MLRSLLKLILILIVVVAAGAFFLGYRWSGSGSTATPTTAPATRGTSGESPTARERAREVGAEIGEKVAAGANAAERAVASGEITAKIKAKMALDEKVRALAIDVDTNGSVVTLSGTVNSATERDRALQLARETAGVTSVVDHLRMR